MIDYGNGMIFPDAWASGPPDPPEPCDCGICDACTPDEFDGAGCCPEEDGWLRARAAAKRTKGPSARDTP